MEYPWVLLLIIPLIPFLMWLLKREFLVLKEELAVKLQKRRVRRLMLVTRTLLFILVLIALASPYVQREKIIEGDPFIQLLVDNSTSMAVFEDISQQLSARLEKHLNTEVKVVGSGVVSNIGDAVLNHLEPHGSVLLLSDGNANSGASLGDVALFASKLNASISAVRLNPKQNDANVVVFGPSKTLENSENTFSVLINRVGDVKGVRLQVVLDGEVVYDQVTNDKIYQFTRQLPKGIHKIVAKIDSNDFFPNNNVFYKTVKVVPQPKVLFYSEEASPMETLLKQLYIVDTATSLPQNLNDYYAVVINDLNADEVNPVSDVLNDFVADGNGMVVFGGENSFDKGGYINSEFETLLPVMVGSPEKKEGDVHVAIVIDISGSQGAAFGRFESTADFSKSATLEIMRNVNVDTRVAVIAFNTQAYLLSEPSPVFQKQGFEDVIGRLKWGGGTNLAAGILKAISVIGPLSGSKNIVLLSDGKTQNQASAYEAAKYASNGGIKIYTVGVGPTTDEKVMMDLAEISNGIYFRATEETRLRILFGPVDEQAAESGRMELVVLNKNHFITENLEPNATLYGFNQVSPKGAARLLATTSTGEPALTIWRLGLGRVGVFSVDDGSKWAGSLLGQGNSRLIARTMNWAIGDPERKSASFIDAKDTRLNEPAEITVKSSVPPDAPNVVFYKIDEDLYSGSIVATQVGFQEAAGAVFAVNYETEFEQIGLNPELEKIAGTTGGRVFDANDIDGMVEHAKTKSKRIINSRDYVRWPFVVLAVIIFLVEIFIRRIMRRE
jgi:uncharacterized membrane protein